MAHKAKYHLGKSSYVKALDEKSRDYQLNKNNAERARSDNGGQPSLQEAEYYNLAFQKCEEIMSMHPSQCDVYAQWKQRRDSCADRVREITAALAPPSGPTPTPVSPEPSNDGPDSPGPIKDWPTPDPEDGFTTNNANADVSAETIRSWYQKKPDTNFDSLIGMESLKNRLMTEAASIGWDLIDRDLNISPVQSYFFYGPPGSGKTAFIRAFASEMMDKGFCLIQLVGSEIHSSLVGVAEKIVTAAFREAIDHSPSIIFFDEVDGVCANRSSHNIASHEKRITNAFLEARNEMNNCGKRVIFLGATNHPADVDPAMLDSVKLIQIPLPDTASRAGFLERALAKITPEDGFTYHDMAVLADGYSFRELKDLAETIKAYMKPQLIEQYSVVNENGEQDQEKTDQAAHEALEAKKVHLSRAVFEAKLSENPPKDKTAVLDELKAFEGSVSSLG